MKLSVTFARHHEVVVDIPRSADRREGQGGLRARPRVRISRQERGLSSADPARTS